MNFLNQNSDYMIENHPGDQIICSIQIQIEGFELHELNCKNSIFEKQFQALITFARSSFLDYSRIMTGFYIRLYIYKCQLACTVILGSVSGIFRYIQALFKSIPTHIQNLVYPCQIQNPGIFLLQSIFKLQGIFIIPY